MTQEQFIDFSKSPYHLLVAMVGHNPRFANPERLAKRRANFYDLVCRRLEAKLQQPVLLVIEDVRTPAIHSSMYFDSALIDLTFCSLAESLELAQRVAQVIGSSVFVQDKHKARSWNGAVITYDMNTSDEGAASDQITNKLAMNTVSNAMQRVMLARLALQQDEVLVSGYLKHAVNLNRAGDYAKAVAVLTALKPLAGENASLYQQLGIAYGKLNTLDQAETLLRHALEIDPENAEVWANVGGILRRKALHIGSHIDHATLQAARDCYARSSQLDPFNTYPLTNLIRIDLLLASNNRNGPMQKQSIADFNRLETLCREKLTITPRDFWIRFDLADAILFGALPTDSLSTALAEFDQAIADVPAIERAFVFKTVRTVVEELVHFGVGNEAQQEMLHTWRTRLNIN